MIGQKLNIKPLSVNKAWKGRRYKTDDYKTYQNAVLLMLSKEVAIPEGQIAIYLEFGFSSKLADFDNPVKLFVDCLQKKYGFDDRRIKTAVIESFDDLKKGEEYVYFEMSCAKTDRIKKYLK